MPAQTRVIHYYVCLGAAGGKEWKVNMKVTMKDIAKELNISINAVSIALNDKPGVSDSMRLKILRTADKI